MILVLDIAKLTKPVGQLFHAKYFAACFVLLSLTVSEAWTILDRLMALADVLVMCLAVGVI